MLGNSFKRSVRLQTRKALESEEAVEQADEADEARGVAERSMVFGAFRGWVRIVRGGARSRASQLIRGVLRTNGIRGLA